MDPYAKSNSPGDRNRARSIHPQNPSWIDPREGIPPDKARKTIKLDENK
jgi:hypothetical protein